MSKLQSEVTFLNHANSKKDFMSLGKFLLFYAINRYCCQGCSGSHASSNSEEYKKIQCPDLCKMDLRFVLPTPYKAKVLVVALVVEVVLCEDVARGRCL